MNPKKLMDDHGLTPKKNYGQNFMHDPNAREKIIRTADLSPTDTVIEVGPGTGILTTDLAAEVKQVISIEIDKRLEPILNETFQDTHNINFIFEDILKTIPADLLNGETDYKVVANVPYYITSAILRHFLEAPIKPKMLVITMQLEVAERLVATAGDMSLLAVSVQYYGQARLISKLNPAVFWPRPEVDSAIIRIDTYDHNPLEVPSDEAFFRVVKAGFSMKRKQLKNSLSGGLGLKSTELESLTHETGIDLRRRAETLSLTEWAALSRALKAGDII